LASKRADTLFDDPCLVVCGDDDREEARGWRELVAVGDAGNSLLCEAKACKNDARHGGEKNVEMPTIA
jgi:hypothetical protein